MDTHRWIAATALVSVSLLSGPASAWNDFGHMEVAAVAWEQMSDAAKARATALITRNPNFDKLVAGAPADKRDKFAFMRAATWPDMIKGDHDHHDDGTDGGNTPPNTPEASQNVGYTDKARHKYWHFVDEPFSTDHTRTQPPKDPNALTQIPLFRATLPASSTADDDLRSYDLVWLLHLVGDIHQPLHATSRFSHALSDGDNGGNSVKVTCGQVKVCGASKLHGYWDDLLGPDDASPADVEAAANALPKAAKGAASLTDVAKWVDESFKAAKATVYKSPIGNGAGPFTLTGAYDSKAHMLAKQRVALAGARLANLLNAAFK